MPEFFFKYLYLSKFCFLATSLGRRHKPRIVAYMVTITMKQKTPAFLHVNYTAIVSSFSVHNTSYLLFSVRQQHKV